MTLDLACAECEASFELDVTDLLDEPGKLACPNCDAKAPRRKAEALSGALDELLKAVGGLAEKFSVTLTAETDDLPAAYEPGGKAKAKAAASDDEEEDSDEDDDEDEDEEEGYEEPLGDEGDSDD